MLHFKAEVIKDDGDQVEDLLDNQEESNEQISINTQNKENADENTDHPKADGSVDNKQREEDSNKSEDNKSVEKKEDDDDKWPRYDPFHPSFILNTVSLVILHPALLQINQEVSSAALQRSEAVQNSLSK